MNSANIPEYRVRGNRSFRIHQLQTRIKQHIGAGTQLNNRSETVAIENNAEKNIVEIYKSVNEEQLSRIELKKELAHSIQLEFTMVEVKKDGGLMRSIRVILEKMLVYKRTHTLFTSTRNCKSV